MESKSGAMSSVCLLMMCFGASGMLYVLKTESDVNGECVRARARS